MSIIGKPDVAGGKLPPIRPLCLRRDKHIADDTQFRGARYSSKKSITFLTFIPS